jgi:hypothetical protein
MRRSLLACLIAGFLVVLVAVGAAHEEPGKDGHRANSTGSAPSTGIRITMEQLHMQGGVPRGWRFTVPPGDPVAGRKVFIELECFKCHSVRGESFPSASARQADEVGPDLSGMGEHHPPEYFAESILHPNQVLVEGPGYIGPDGKSRMPEYQESMTLREWLDLVAYLGGLKDPGHSQAHAAHGPKRVGEATAGDYRIALRLADSGVGHGGSHGASAHGHAMPMTGTAATAKHLIAEILDRETGEAVPYLPVEADILAAGKTQRVPLQVMLGAGGLHYGADVAVAPGKVRVTLHVGPSRLHRMASAPDRYQHPVQAVFEWGE